MNEKFYTKGTIGAVKAAKSVAALSEFYQMFFLKELFKELTDDQQQLWIERSLAMKYPEAERKAFEAYAENSFEEDDSMTTEDVVYYYMRNRSIDVYMEIELLKQAQCIRKSVICRRLHASRIKKEKG